jgi:endonuclease-3
MLRKARRVGTTPQRSRAVALLALLLHRRILVNVTCMPAESNHHKIAQLHGAAPEEIRAVMDGLAAAYHGRGAVELGDPYQILVATVISQRTREEQTTAVSQRVFARYPNAAALAAADEAELYDLLEGSEYRRDKAPRLIALAGLLVERFQGRVPDTIEELLTLPGVGRKTANCVLIYAFQKDALCVDIHCHRITNRLGWVSTKTPDQTERALEKAMPRDLWAGSNRLFLQHGRTLCLPGTPICSRCPVRPWCAYGRSDTTRKR